MILVVPRFGIDLDFADVAAGGEGEVGRIVERAVSFSPGSMPGRQVVGGIGGKRHLEPRYRLVGAGDLELAVLDDDVALIRLHQVGGDLLRLGLDLVERLDDGRHADRPRARAVGAHAHLHLVGVAVDDVDAVDRHAEAVGDQLGEGGFMPLPVAVRPGQNLDGADGIDSDLGRFPETDAGTERADRRRRRDAAGLDIAAHANAALHARV